MEELARDYMRRAQVRLESAERTFASGDYPDTVRFSQECVELSLKAALRFVGVEYPKEHDVGKIMKMVEKRFPAWFRDEIDKMAEISEELVSKRSASLYGLEIANKPPASIFGKKDAEAALSGARFVISKVKELLS
jgi:HEPN domain-containing protein